MGLVFVLLLGEIDLSAGSTGGVCAAIMAGLMVRHDLPVAARHPRRARAPASSSALHRVAARPKVRIPSFVVTLALFLAFQGVR